MLDPIITIYVIERDENGSIINNYEIGDSILDFGILNGSGYDKSKEIELQIWNNRDGMYISHSVKECKFAIYDSTDKLGTKPIYNFVQIKSLSSSNFIPLEKNSKFEDLISYCNYEKYKYEYEKRINGLNNDNMRKYDPANYNLEKSKILNELNTKYKNKISGQVGGDYIPIFLNVNLNKNIEPGDRKFLFSLHFKYDI